LGGEILGDGRAAARRREKPKKIKTYREK